MTAEAAACQCSVCGTRCEGRFKACTAVWSRGAHDVAFLAPASAPASAPAPVAGSIPRPAAGVALDDPPRPAAPPTPTPTNLFVEDSLRAICTALEAVGAELRSLRTAVDAGRTASRGGPEDHAVLDRLAELLHRLPVQVRAAVREAMSRPAAEQAHPPPALPPNGRHPGDEPGATSTDSPSDPIAVDGPRLEGEGGGGRG